MLNRWGRGRALGPEVPWLRPAWRKVWLCLLMLLGAWPALAAHPPRILLLHSYHQSYSWTAGIHGTLVDRLQSADPSVDIRTEYLDWKHFPRKEMLEETSRLMRAKYGNNFFDLVVASDNTAVEFVKAHRADLFPDVPMVFCGYNGYRPGTFGDLRGVTGVAEDVDPAGTLALALRMHPRTQKVVIVVDRSEGGLVHRADLEAALPGMGLKVPVFFSEEEGARALVARLAREPETTLILLCGYANDGEGRYLDLWEMPKRLQETGVRAPVWGIYEECLGWGMVGGRLQSARRQGGLAADMALRILAGTPADQIPVLDAPTVQTIFDARALAHFGLKGVSLPSGSEVRFQQASFYHRNRILVLGSLVVLVLAVVGLAGLLVWRLSLERRLRRSEARMRGVVQHMPFLSCALDGEGRMVLWNRACEELTGRSLEALAAEEDPLTALLPGSGARDLFLALAQGKVGTEGVELPMNGRDGQPRTIRWYSQAQAFPIPGWGGWLVGVDVTAQREAEASRRRLALAMAQSVEGILLTDREGRVTDANPAVATILGLSRQGALGKGFPDLFSDSPDATDIRRRWQDVRAGLAWTGRVALVRPSGEIRVLLVSLFPVVEAGKVTATAAVMRDLTEQVAFEEQAARAQRMDSLGTLASGVAHDFRNLMGAVLGNADLLAEELRPGGEGPTFLAHLRAAAGRGVELVQQLLGFARSRPEAVALVAVSDLLRELKALASHAMPSHVKLDLRPGSGPFLVRGDAGQLLQVLLNLVLNARDALPGGGLIQVTTRAEGGDVVLEVADNGIGMEPEVVSRVFEPMFTTKAPGVGTGMGLAMVYSLVRSHGGQVTVDSRRGEGTTFQVRLPKVE